MIDVGTTKQIFVDDALIESMVNVFQVLNAGRKHGANPLIVADRPWEETKTIYVYGTALHDPGAQDTDRFRIWYCAGVREYGSRDHAGLLFAHSGDGIHWDKPALGVASVNGCALNNACWTNNSRGWISTDGLSYDPDDGDPSGRYKLLGFLGADEPQSSRPGYGAFFSPDGIHWTPYDGNPVFPYDHVSVCEVATSIYNEQSVRPRKDHILDMFRYYASVKYSSWMCAPIHDPSFQYMRRSAGIMTSNDFIHWSPNQLVLQPDDLDDFLARRRVMSAWPALKCSRPGQVRAEFYGMALMPAGDVLLGLLWVLDSSGSVRDDGGNQDGPVHVQLVGTRDLRRWLRLGERMPLLAPGSPGEWDCGSVYTVNKPMVVGDEIWLYYAGHNQGHHSGPDAVGSIGLATWRLDGFVSINANASPGTLITRPLAFAGDGLVINAWAPSGSVVVELLEECGRPIAGFEASECRSFQGDAVRHAISWRDNPSLGALAGKLVRLKFHLSSARLYSFAFT